MLYFNVKNYFILVNQKFDDLYKLNSPVPYLAKDYYDLE